jgi:hypothetical protein
MGTIKPAVSAVLNQPSPISIDVPLAETAAAVSVGTVPVGVYEGRSVAAPAWLIDVGGHANEALALAAICPLPAGSVPLQGEVPLQKPTAERGSVGIQPFCRPSWYDHEGDSTLPVTDELPIFHVQKNQFCGRRGD